MDPKQMEEIFKGVKVCVGLTQQGHLYRVAEMIIAQKTWDEIGREIGWDATAAKQWYEFESAQQLAAATERITELLAKIDELEKKVLVE